MISRSKEVTSARQFLTIERRKAPADSKSSSNQKNLSTEADLMLHFLTECQNPQIFECNVISEISTIEETKQPKTSELQLHEKYSFYSFIV